MVTIEAYANGISALAIIITGYVIGTRLLFARSEIKSKLLPWQVVFAYSLGSFYLGTAVSFITLVWIGANINGPLAAILCYTVSPIGSVCIMYIGFSMIKPKWAKPVAIIFAITAIPFWANLWFNIGGQAATFEFADSSEELIDIALQNWSQIGTTFYILTMLAISGTGFIYLATHSSGEIRTRSWRYAAGIIIFCLMGIIDSRVPGLGVWIVLVRIVMVAGYICLYKAMVPPKSEFYPDTKK